MVDPLHMRTVSESVQQPSLLRFVLWLPTYSFTDTLSSSTSYLHTWQFQCALSLAIIFLTIRILRRVLQIQSWPIWAIVSARVLLLIWILGLMINIVLNVGSLLNSGGGVWNILTQFGPDAPSAFESATKSSEASAALMYSANVSTNPMSGLLPPVGATSEFDSDDSPQWAKTLADSFFLDIMVYEAIVRSYIILYPHPDGLVPSYHRGSIDGDFLWAAVLYMHYAIELLPLMLLKWLHMATLLSHLACNMAVDNERLGKICANAPKAVHWIRRIHLGWSIAVGYGVPWLMWVPDMLVLAAAVLFNFGVGVGVAVSTHAAQINSREDAQIAAIRTNLAGAQAMQQRSLVQATSPVLERRLLGGNLDQDEAESLYRWFLDTNQNMPTEDIDDYNDQLWLSDEGEDKTNDGSISGELEDEDEDEKAKMNDRISADEIEQLLSDAYAGSEVLQHKDALDESYLCPGRVFTRQMRHAVLHNEPNALNKQDVNVGAQGSQLWGHRRRSLSSGVSPTLNLTLASLKANGMQFEEDALISNPSSPTFATYKNDRGSATVVPTRSQSLTAAGAKRFVKEAASAVRDVAMRVERFHRVLASHAPVARMVDRILSLRQRENQRRNDHGIKCVVCTTRMRDIILQPCNHLCICEDCKIGMGQQNIGRCPVCSSQVTGTVKIFWS
ncbi:hypothetical protein RTP6_005777 [Batrachochytrium dendrobatidis]